MIEQRDKFMRFLSLVIIIVGLLLLGLTFNLTYNLYADAPEKYLGIKPGSPIDLNEVNQRGVMFVSSMIEKTITLLIMCLVSSVFFFAGIKLYARSRNNSSSKKTSNSQKENQ